MSPARTPRSISTFLPTVSVSTLSPDASVVQDYRSGDNVLTLTTGKKVLIERGVRAGDIYEYLGPTVTLVPDHTVSSLSTSVNVAKGDYVKTSNGLLYERVGASLPTANLTTVDFAAAKGWSPVSALQSDYANPDL